MARRIVDLTQPLDQLGSNGEFSVREYERPRSGHGVFHRVDMETTAGTHVVTSRRYLASGYSLSDTPLDKFFGEGVVVRLPAADGMTEIGTSQLDDAAGDRVRRGDIAVLAPVPDTSARIKITVFASQWFWKKGIKMLVLDHRIGIGSVASWSEERTVLTSLFANEIPVVRGATNTEALSDERFAVMALPMRIEGVEAWPVRLVALDPGEAPTAEPPADASIEPAAVATAEAGASEGVTATESAKAAATAAADGELSPTESEAKATDASAAADAEPPAEAEAGAGESEPDASAEGEATASAAGESPAEATDADTADDASPADASVAISQAEDVEPSAGGNAIDDSSAEAETADAGASSDESDESLTGGDDVTTDDSEPPPSDAATDSESKSSRRSES